MSNSTEITEFSQDLFGSWNDHDNYFAVVDNYAVQKAEKFDSIQVEGGFLTGEFESKSAMDQVIAPPALNVQETVIAASTKYVVKSEQTDVQVVETASKDDDEIFTDDKFSRPKVMSLPVLRRRRAKHPKLQSKLAVQVFNEAKEAAELKFWQNYKSKTYASKNGVNAIRSRITREEYSKRLAFAIGKQQKDVLTLENLVKVAQERVDGLLLNVKNQEHHNNGIFASTVDIPCEAPVPVDAIAHNHFSNRPFSVDDQDLQNVYVEDSPQASLQKEFSPMETVDYFDVGLEDATLRFRTNSLDLESAVGTV